MMSFHPQTPQSPSQLSPSTSDPMTSMTSSMISTTTTLPTPAHSVNGSSILSEMNNDTVMGDDTPQKRKRSGDEQGERDAKKVHTEGRRYGIENLHMNMGEKYLLCRTPYPPPRSQMSQDLFEIYGLTGIAAEVARVLPNGEKNALRKTYKGHIKKLGVEGHFDAVKEAWERPDSLLSLAKCPNDEWNVHFVRGKDIKDGFTPEVKSRLARACTMSKGLVPKTVWDSSVLGDLSAAIKADKQSPSARPTAPNTPLPSGITPINRQKLSAPMSSADANRPKRNIKKRGYGDSSFEGYDEGFPDDDGGAGYSTGEGEMGSGRKKMKKSHPVGQQSYTQARQPSYGLSMSGL